MFNTLKKDLVNFPDDIIRDWLVPLTPFTAWPPDCSLPKWRGILLGEQLEFWLSITWDKRRVNLSDASLVERSKDVIRQMYDAHVMGADNAFLDHPTSNNSFIFSLQHLLRHDSFKEPLILLKRDNKYELADGHHRYLSFVVANEIYQLSKSTSTDVVELCEKLKKKWGIDKIVPLCSFYETWVAVP